MYGSGWDDLDDIPEDVLEEIYAQKAARAEADSVALSPDHPVATPIQPPLRCSDGLDCHETQGTDGNAGNEAASPEPDTYSTASPPGDADGCSLTIAVAAHGGRLAKLWKLDGTCQPYDTVRTFNLHPHPVADLGALAETLRGLLPLRYACILRGATVNGEIMKQVRRLLHPDQKTGDAPTLREVPRRWVALDLDDIPLPDGTDPQDLAACAAAVRRYLPHAFRDAAAIICATASHGIKPGARLRWWAWLSRSATGAELEQWFAGFPVDVSTFRPVQPIYTAKPLFAAGREDPIPERLLVLRGAREVVQVPPPMTLRAVKVEKPAVSPSLGEFRGDGTAAMKHVQRTIAAAPINTRHDTAKRMAAFLANLVREGKLTAAEAISAIEDGIEAAGKDRAEGEALAKWALDHNGGRA